MRLSALTRMHSVQKEEKEQRLKDFIARDMAARRAAGPSTERAVYRLVALSPDSPVAKALADIAAEAAALGINIEAVFLRTMASASGPAAPASFPVCRHVSDTRVIDAHEQLVLGPQTTWIGDAMRRDPGKRDAYERFSEACEMTATNAIRAFDRLWSMGKPARRLVAPQAAPASTSDSVLDPALMGNADQVPSAFVLRH
jgi:hypothetical protein